MTPDRIFITEHARSRALKPEAIRVVVTLPTFRRPDHLITTLDSLQAQGLGPDTAVVIMDNDAEGLEGAMAAADWLETSSVKGIVIVAHQRGNCHAYNAGWETALAEFPKLTHIAVIDDDEIAGPGWLSGLLTTARKTGADLVGGPQIPVFADKSLNGWRRHPVFTPHYTVTGPVPILYSSGNVLISRSVLDMMPRPYLDPAFNFIGGGDSDFYRRAKARGFGFGWSADAAVMETLPSRRAEFSWLNARSLRNGAISSILEKRQRPGIPGRVRTIVKSLALLAAAPWRGLRLGVQTGSAVIGLYHIQVALGRLMEEFGMVNEQYRNPESN
ncbi:putative glycosyltransferase [Hoeflea sp. IMCC20628]|uniref:glycosyltransferase family 2 protein n=1 Tax=Hoeflea sp. IMCC20628 TaxID=1620421 RepID=UPI00063A8DF8|nr:glycosyltransferase [Hoeflea sp. IMCC20628]AKI02127.1 putative glycosyltransferase [Hoeflea sp. IMCC20628]